MNGLLFVCLMVGSVCCRVLMYGRFCLVLCWLFRVNVCGLLVVIIFVSLWVLVVMRVI